MISNVVFVKSFYLNNKKHIFYFSKKELREVKYILVFLLPDFYCFELILGKLQFGKKLTG